MNIHEIFAGYPVFGRFIECNAKYSASVLAIDFPSDNEREQVEFLKAITELSFKSKIILYYDVDSELDAYPSTSYEETFYDNELYTIRKAEISNFEHFMKNNLELAKEHGFVFVSDKNVFALDFRGVTLFQLDPPQQALIDFFKAEMGYKYKSLNVSGNITLRNQEKNEYASPYDKAPIYTVYPVKDVSELDPANNYFKSFSGNIMNNFIKEIDGSLRFSFEQESWANKGQSLLNMLAPKGGVRMIYHGVFSNIYEYNYLVSESPMYGEGLDAPSLQSFALPLDNFYDHVRNNIDEIVADRSVFIHEDFILGIYDQGVDIFFLSRVLKQEFLSAANGLLGEV